MGLALTGIGLLAILGIELLGQPWLLVALTIYAINLIVAAFISRPNLRRLLRMDSGDPAAWDRRARRQRYVAYGMAAATGVIGFLMMSKPGVVTRPARQKFGMKGRGRPISQKSPATMSSSAITKTANHFRTSNTALSSAFGRQLTVPPRRGDSTRPVQPRTGQSGAP